MWETRVQSLGKKDPLEKKRQPTPVFLPGESNGQRNLVGHTQSMGSQTVRHDWVTNTHTHTHTLPLTTILPLSPHLTPAPCSMLIKAGRTSSPTQPLQLYNCHAAPPAPLLITLEPQNAFTASQAAHASSKQLQQCWPAHAATGKSRRNPGQGKAREVMINHLLSLKPS